MPGDRDRSRSAPRPRWPAVSALALALGLACTPSTESASRSPQTRASEPANPDPQGSSLQVRTVNPDRRGFDNQPDYEGEAARLRDYVDGRLPSPLPRDRKAACAAMFAAVDTFYASVEHGSPARAGEVAGDLAATRAIDLAACERETSAKAAACVTALLGDRTAEFPWLLDQCSRAYPDA